MTKYTKTVLLVEDNPDDEELALRAFRKNKIANKVVVARDGVEALDYLFASGPHASRNPNELPSLILLDLNLPKIDGIEVLRRVRAHDRTHLLPIVVMTSSKEDKDMIESYQLGANSYVRKPIKFDDFLEATRQLGLYWLVLNETPPAAVPA